MTAATGDFTQYCDDVALSVAYLFYAICFDEICYNMLYIELSWGYSKSL